MLLAYVFVRGSSGLRRYILTRISLTLPMVFILATLVFFVMHILPGDPVSSALGPKGTPALVAQIKQELGLNDPIGVQYGRFLIDVVTLRFGNSLVLGHRPIIDEMSERFPATLELVIPASILALLIGILGGTFAASAPQERHRLRMARVFCVHLLTSDFLAGLDAATPVRGPPEYAADLRPYRSCGRVRP